MSKSVVFNLPNTVVYIRILLLIIACLFAFTHPLLTFLLFYSSGLMDMLDGYLARRFNQQTKLGQILDMTVDRLCETMALILLCMLYPKYWLFFLFAICLDIAAHFLILGKTYLSNQQTHKQTDTTMPACLKHYYGSRLVLMLVVIAYENFGIWLYLYHAYPMKWIAALVILFSFGFVYKLLLNVQQLYYSMNCIAQYR